MESLAYKTSLVETEAVAALNFGVSVPDAVYVVCEFREGAAYVEVILFSYSHNSEYKRKRAEAQGLNALK